MKQSLVKFENYSVGILITVVKTQPKKTAGQMTDQ